MISLDTVRPDYLGCYGNEQVRTPRIDALADESILFTDLMTVVPSTLAAHVSLFTGKYPHRHGTPRNRFRVNPENVMLQEILREAGFHTAGFAGSFALESRFGFAQGFDHYDESFDVVVAGDGPEQPQRPATDVTGAVVRYLGGIEMPPHLFLFVHYFDAHLPYSPPAPYDETYRSEDLREQKGSNSRPMWNPIRAPLLGRRSGVLEIPVSGSMEMC